MDLYSIEYKQLKGMRKLDWKTGLGTIEVREWVILLLNVLLHKVHMDTKTELRKCSYFTGICALTNTKTLNKVAFNSLVMKFQRRWD